MSAPTSNQSATNRRRPCGVCLLSSGNTGFRSLLRAFSWPLMRSTFSADETLHPWLSAHPDDPRSRSCISRMQARQIPIQRGCRAACRTCSSRGWRRRAASRSSASGACSKRSGRAVRRTCPHWTGPKPPTLRAAPVPVPSSSAASSTRAPRFVLTRRSKILRPVGCSERRPCAAPMCLRSSISSQRRSATLWGSAIQRMCTSRMSRRRRSRRTGCTPKA